MKKPSQWERMLWMLQRNPSGVCSMKFLYGISPVITRPAARFGDLQEKGYDVESVDCTEHGAGGAKHAKYRMREKEAKLW